MQRGKQVFKKRKRERWKEGGEEKREVKGKKEGHKKAKGRNEEKESRM